ncbi:MAG: anhydro-N-acetylmuramic acid kinase [Rickettsiaceae bacterium]|nr:anhydro-N-acetylmuramic acid kinase [Rickettsiaceae bacterium]MDP4833008.1 anhydro-N-acetylmuramic acid kinase [Rickettsiaceae bacterium]MDP5020639.1 anhydro-N-acetylmuramic acid kinase [Rickettsiaceae bacterium]MDP5083016.1 anhydro-N-acetylmuramic acid kinase [Rickettsiaceae bacterium]
MSELYIGFMSGTSLDGVDASLIRTNGIDEFVSIENIHIAYPTVFRNKMRALLTHMGLFLDLEKQLTEFHIEATQQILNKAKLDPAEIKALGFHGQTLFHEPQNGLTLQIGNPHLLAQATGIDVVHDFRRRDVSLGGQGAPLVPIFHELLVRAQQLPVAVVNIGGVANITYVDEARLIAFDTGPGGALIDDAMLEYFGKPFDDNGEIAASGKVDKLLVDKVLLNKYFNAPYPKSLDRNAFVFLKDMFVTHSPVEIIATLTYLTSASIAHAVSALPNMPGKLFLCGGGRKNTQMIEWIKEILAQDNKECKIEDIAIISNLDSDYIESQAFAYITARFFKNLPSAFPTTTNASRANICGCFVQSSKGD